MGHNQAVCGTMTRIRLTQIDGKLPNLALMRLSAWHKRQGDDVTFSRRVTRDMFEPAYDTVYGSTIFTFSANRTERFKHNFPGAIIGGTGVPASPLVESIVKANDIEYDYSLYPDYQFSIGFLHRGCRLKCKFCVVPTKEGKPWAEMTVNELWRGDPYPRKLHLLDNDFFSLPTWQDRINEIREGKFKICLNQGINVRLINDEAAEALASIEYRDDQFQTRRLYTAWDNLKDEKIFFRGIDCLERHGIPPKNVMAYMLIGYDPKEDWERILRRFDLMVERGVMPYPMVYNNERRDLKAFQRWAVTGLYRAVPWKDYRVSQRRASADAILQSDMFAEAAL